MSSTGLGQSNRNFEDLEAQFPILQPKTADERALLVSHFGIFPVRYRMLDGPQSRSGYEIVFICILFNDVSNTDGMVSNDW
jgi:hypothetical protein